MIVDDYCWLQEGAKSGAFTAGVYFWPVEVPVLSPILVASVLLSLFSRRFTAYESFFDPLELFKIG